MTEEKDDSHLSTEPYQKLQLTLWGLLLTITKKTWTKGRLLRRKRDLRRQRRHGGREPRRHGLRRRENHQAATEEVQD